MQTTRLGRSELEVSRFCLGTMPWGSQNSATEAHAQIDLALDRGITLLDTAEMYPTTPVSRETAGATESIIGAWIARTGRRHDIVLATKIVGPGSAAVRDGGPITPARLRAALEGSLGRLRTDHVDLYQLHWPNRGSYHFRRSSREMVDAARPSAQAIARSDRPSDSSAPMRSLSSAVRWEYPGMAAPFLFGDRRIPHPSTVLHLTLEPTLPRVASIQNEYNLLCRHFDLDLAELAHHEDVGLLAYSPLAAGLLTGKYAGGARPPGSRATINRDLAGRISPHSEPVAAAYVDLARTHGLDPSQMALAFVAARPFTASVILGATSTEQLATDIGAADVTLTPEILDGIAAIRRRDPVPM
jgi:aryl-alcohol dehydrogenase-like predicted oxidoreductase